MDPIIATMIRLSGRSWWQARYSNGRVLSEWDTLTGKLLLPGGNGKSSRWEEIPKKGMVGLRLLCPNGIAGELEAPEGHRFFQLKVGKKTVAIRFNGTVTGNQSERIQEAHIIGVIIDAEGNCLCRAWETTNEIVERGKTTQTIPVGANYLVDNIKQWEHNLFLRMRGIVHVFGVSRQIWGNTQDTITIMGRWPETIKGSPSAIPNNTEYLITAPRNQLIEFRDNIFNMRYRNIGRLSLEVQQLKV